MNFEREPAVEKRRFSFIALINSKKNLTVAGLNSIKDAVELNWTKRIKKKNNSKEGKGRFVMKKRIVGFMAVLSLAILGFSTAASAVSFNSVYYISRENTVGTSYSVMSADSTTHCFLIREAVRETDTGAELAECNIYNSNGVWILQANLGASSDADVYCGALCYNN